MGLVAHNLSEWIISLTNPLIYAQILGAKSFFRPVDSLKILGIKVSTIG
jgi:hypothetical protein